MASVRLIVRLSALGALLLTGCGLMPSVPGAPTFQADRLVAADTWSFTDLTLRPSVQQALYVKDALDLFKDATDLHQMPTPSGRKVDFEKDLLPHLDGEVVVAVGGPVDHPQYSLLVHTNDVDGMLRLLADDPAAVFTRDARGALRSQARHGTDALAGYKNWVVYTNGASTLDAILDRLDGKGGPTLATEPRYRSVVDKLSGDRLGYGYLDVTPLVGQMPRNTPRFSESLTTHGRVAYSLGFEAGPESGVQVLGVQSVFMPDTPSVGTLPPSPDALVAMDRLPQNSMVAVAVSNIDTQSSFAALEKDQRDSGALDALLADAAGPYALAVTPPSDGADPSVNKFVGGLFFLTRVAPGVSADDLDALDDAIGQGLAQGSQEFAGWDHQVSVDDDWLTISAGATSESLDQASHDVLASNRTYQWLRPVFVQDGGNFFLDLSAVEANLAQQPGSRDAFAAISPVRAVGASWQADAGGGAHAHLQMILAHP